MPQKPNEICDYDCPFADFPPADTAGICRTMSAVWCKKLKALVNKNTPCEWQAGQRSPAKAAAATSRKTSRKKTKTPARKKSTRKRTKM